MHPFAQVLLNQFAAGRAPFGCVSGVDQYHRASSIFRALDADTGEPSQPVQLSGTPRPPEAWESSFKDTVVAYPGQVTRIQMQFNTAGQYAWHCHIVEHEDNEMMRPYRVGPEQPGRPL